MGENTLTQQDKEVRLLREQVAELKKKLELASVEQEIERLVYEGKVLPGEKEIVKQLMMSLPGDEETIELAGANGEVKKYSPRGLLVAFLRSQDKRIEFGEVAKKENAKEDEEMTGYVKTNLGLVDKKKLEIDKQVRKLMNERGISDYSTALGELMKEKPELFKLVT